MQQALIVCDQFCFSRARLLDTLEHVRQRLSGFDFRLASEAESTEILATHKPKFLPLIVLGSHSIAGVPSSEELEQWLLNLSST
ncbi:MAG: hypothetical protein IGS03_12090 [Candidatus Sericytochromatia bacterium]|nr:hypothetical protein [Candidatus Sericytochromatia bacterium]